MAIDISDDQSMYRSTSCLITKNDKVINNDDNVTCSNNKYSNRSQDTSTLVSSSFLTKNTLNKKVSFQNEIKIIEFPMELGDNPSAYGIPIQIGWKSQCTYVVSLDDNERRKGGGDDSKKRNNEKIDMIIPLKKKFNLVMKSGATMFEINKTIKENEIIQRLREESIQNMEWDNFIETIESTTRKLRRIISWSTTHSASSSPSYGFDRCMILLEKYGCRGASPMKTIRFFTFVMIVIQIVLYEQLCN